MTAQRETPAPQRRQAEGDTGVRVARESVPAWAQKRVGASLVRFRGQYLTPEGLNAQARTEAALGRVVGTAHGDALTACLDSDVQPGAGGSPIPETAATPSAERLCWEPRELRWDAATGELLPCRSLETTQSRTDGNTLSGAHKKTASALSWNVAHLCEKYGVDRIGFLTLTFADHVLCPKEAQRRFNSLASNVLKTRYLDYIRVLERQKTGRIHYHLLVVLPDDIRTGFKFEGVAKKDYSSANNHLRREWAFWRKTAPFYRFGRTELMPVKGSSAALGQYVGKYIGKHIGARIEQDKGVRLVTYTRGARMATSRHTVIGLHNTNQWRGKVETFARQMTENFRVSHPHRPAIRSVEDLSFYLGPKWAYHWRDYIFSLPPADLTVPF